MVALRILRPVARKGAMLVRTKFAQGMNMAVFVAIALDVELADDSVGWVYAQLDWPSPESPPVLHPIRTDGFIRVADVAVDAPRPIAPNSVVSFGDHHVRLPRHPRR